MNTNITFGKMTVKAAGVTFQERQGKLWNIKKYAKAHDGRIITMLRREKNNQYDPNAIAVLVQTDTTVAKIGYVPADIAVWLAKKMDAGLTVRAYHGHVTDGLRTTPKNKTLGFTFDICHEIPRRQRVAVALATEET